VTVEVRTETVPDDRPLLAWLPDRPDDERFVFASEGDGFVGWGVAARITVGTGPDRFARARDGLRGLAGPAPLVAFASFAFDEADDGSSLVIPQVVVRRQGGTVTRTTIMDGPAAHARSSDTSHVRSRDSASSGDRPRYAGSTLRDDAWLDAVAAAIAAIEHAAYEKVVLARDLHLWSRTPFDVTRVLHDLAARFPSCATFLVDHLVGASPEQLVRRAGLDVSSRVLAGTAPRGGDPAEDAALGAALLGSDKDLREHDLAVRSAVESLQRSCVRLSVPAGPSLVRLDNVQHLGSDLAGTLDDRRGSGAPHVLDLLADLHPTAAVGGAPRAAALEAIRELEGMSRGRYAGPVGWCTPDGDGEFAIALRCAEIRGDRARLFAGAGIVAGSLPEAELTETWLKLQAMTGVLDG